MRKQDTNPKRSVNARFSTVLVYALLAGALALAGCSSFSGSKPGDIPNFRTGTSGLELRFLPNLPPKELLEKGQFRIVVDVRNAGAYDTGDGEINIVGLNDAWVPLDVYSIRLPSLPGRGVQAPDGGLFIAEFPGRNIALPPGVTEYRSKYMAVARYAYSSAAQSDVCINSDIYEVDRGAGMCKVRSSTSLSGQGAPVVVSRVEESIIPSKDTVSVQFTLTIENKGNGELVSPITIDEVKLGTRMLDCNTRTLEIKDIKEKRNKVVCTAVEPLRSPYTSSLSARLFYTYSTKQSGEFVIRRVPGGA